MKTRAYTGRLLLVLVLLCTFYAGDVAAAMDELGAARESPGGRDEDRILVLVGISIASMVATGLGVMFGRRAWREVVSAREEAQQGSLAYLGSGEVAKRLAPDHWRGALASALAGVSAAFVGEKDALSRAVIRSLRDATAALDGLGEVLRSAAINMLDGGEVASALVDVGDTLIYIVVFPGKHDHPRLLKRCHGFSQGWSAHGRDIRRRSLVVDSKALLCLVLFLDSNASEGLLLAGYDGPAGHLAPASLLTTGEVRRFKGMLNGHRQAFFQD